MHVGLALEVGGGDLLVKRQRLPLVHQQRVTQLDAHRLLVILHTRVAIGSADAEGGESEGARGRVQGRVVGPR